MLVDQTAKIVYDFNADSPFVFTSVSDSLVEGKSDVYFMFSTCVCGLLWMYLSDWHRINLLELPMSARTISWEPAIQTHGNVPLESFLISPIVDYQMHVLDMTLI